MQIVDLAGRIDALSGVGGVELLRAELEELRAALGQQFTALEGQVLELSAGAAGAHLVWAWSATALVGAETLHA